MPLCVPVAYVFDLFPAMTWREFSICSIAQEYIDILVGVVAYKTILKAPRRGVGTSYLASLIPGFPGASF
jgi:sulfite reductase alpha subunit-like flavoprotein